MEDTEHPNFKSFIPGIKNFQGVRDYLGYIFDDLNKCTPQSSPLYREILDVVKVNKYLIPLTNEKLLMTTPPEKKEMGLFYHTRSFFPNQRIINTPPVFISLQLKLENIDRLYFLHISDRDCLLFVRMEIKNQHYYIHIYTLFIFQICMTYLHLIFITKDFDVFSKLLLGHPSEVTNELKLCKEMENNNFYFGHLPTLQNRCLDTLLKKKSKIYINQLPPILLNEVEKISEIQRLKGAWFKSIKMLNDFVIQLNSYDVWMDPILYYCCNQNSENTCRLMGGLINVL